MVGHYIVMAEKIKLFLFFSLKTNIYKKDNIQSS